MQWLAIASRRLKGLLSEAAALRGEVAKLTEGLNRVMAALPALPVEASAASEARATGKARGFYVVETFASVVGRHKQWVSQRCKLKLIRTLPGGKPYRIPLSEENRWNGGAA